MPEGINPSAEFLDSPNHDKRDDAQISMIVLHYTGMETADEALARLRDPASKVSAHYLIDRKGQLYQLVSEHDRAWHAGEGSWGGAEDINAISLGIELVNRGHTFGYEAFPDPQIDRLILLLNDLRHRFPVPPARVVGHSDVAPLRKEDPGEKFPWDVLAQENLTIGVYHDDPSDPLPDYADAMSMLEEIGYKVDRKAPVAVTLAFQRRFCPKCLGHGMSVTTRRAIAWAHGEVTRGI